MNKGKPKIYWKAVLCFVGTVVVLNLLLQWWMYHSFDKNAEMAKQRTEADFVQKTFIVEDFLKEIGENNIRYYLKSKETPNKIYLSSAEVSEYETFRYPIIGNMIRVKLLRENVEEAGQNNWVFRLKYGEPLDLYAYAVEFQGKIIFERNITEGKEFEDKRVMGIYNLSVMGICLGVTIPYVLFIRRKRRESLKGGN